ncbi:MAG: hypothetical protein HYY13_12850 [Nitrospirae bacterium]|nr:hypothetical protein [Nitrospirota bacterium]
MRCRLFEGGLETTGEGGHSRVARWWRCDPATVTHAIPRPEKKLNVQI